MKNLFNDKSDMNKRGQVTIFILVGLLIVFIGAIIIMVIGFFSTNLYSALDKNITLGQVNLAEYNDLTIGKFNDMVVNNADWWGIALIFGMVIGLFGGAYFTRNTYPKLGIILDIFIIVIAFLISLYLKTIYSLVVTSLSAAGQDFAIQSMQGTNYFILNLPIFIAIIGVIMMIIFHSSLPSKREELNTVPGVVTG